MARRRSSPRRRTGRRTRWILLTLAAAACAVWCLAPEPTLRPLKRWWGERQGLQRVEGHAEVLRAAARESGVDPNLLAGVMMVESRGHVDARSGAGALGLFQLMPPTAKEHALKLGLAAPTERQLLSDAALNARLGAQYLAWLLPRFEHDEERVLIAYNAGPGRLKRWTEEAGSYAAWRDARERAGNSDVLAYARNVQHYRRWFAERGAIAPTAVAASDPAVAGGSDPSADLLVGPPVPPAESAKQ